MIAQTNGGLLITQIKQIGGRIFEKLLQDAGIEAFNGAQGRILHVLWQADGIPIVELAQRTGLAKTTLTSMLDRMEAAGLVKRSFDQRDRRQVLIVLTRAARALDRQYEEVSTQMNEVYYAGFSDEEILAFEGALKRVLNNLVEKEKRL